MKRWKRPSRKPATIPTGSPPIIAAQHSSRPLAEGEDADPWGDTAIPIPDRFTQNGEPPVVTLTGARPPGGIEVAGGTVRIRFAASDPANGAVTMELSDPPPPPANKPLVVIERGPGGAPHVTVTGGKALVRLAGWDGIAEPAPAN